MYDLFERNLRGLVVNYELQYGSELEFSEVIYFSTHTTSGEEATGFHQMYQQVWPDTADEIWPILIVPGFILIW